MATAINFNWVIKDKVTEGKIYDFSFTETGETEPVQMTFIYTCGEVLIKHGEDEERARVFRDKMRVKDAIAIALYRSGRATSGEVYKCDILTEIRPDYETNEIYFGQFRPSHEFAANKPRKESPFYLGFELETSARNSAAQYALQNIKSNIWREVSDSSISSRGIEFVSTLLHPSDAINPAFFEAFFDTLTGLAISKTDDSCGLHCHISREAFGETDEEQDENIAKAVYLENYIIDSLSLEALFGRPAGDWARINTGGSGFVEHINAVRQYSRAIMNDNGVKTALQRDLMIGNKTRQEHDYPSERYHRINVTNQHTIEFRQGKGNISSTALANIAQHVCTLAKYCRETKWGNLSAEGYARSIPNSNKYAAIKRIFNGTNEG